MSSAYSNGLILSPKSVHQRDTRVDELIKRAQQQNPTKLSYMHGDEKEESEDGGRDMYLDSSESSSFYDRQGSQVLFTHSGDPNGA